MIKHQRNDPIIAACIEQRLAHKRCKPDKDTIDHPWYIKQFPYLKLKNGVLYRAAKIPEFPDVILQVIVPPTLVEEVLQSVHGPPMAGHPSKEKMIQIIKRYAIWPNFWSDINEFVTNCYQCQCTREPNPPIRAPMVPLKVTRPFQQVQADVLKIHPSRKGFIYVVVIIDVFSKWVELYATRTKSATAIADCLQDFSLKHGPPESFSSDNGGEFQNDILNALCKYLGIKKSTSTPYHPQSQGLVENRNRSIISELTKRILLTHDDWPDHIPYLQFMFNTSVHTTTKQTPYFLLHGFEANIPLTGVLPSPDARLSVRDYIGSSTSKYEAAMQNVREQMDKEKARQKANYDKKEKFVPYKEGDQVWELQHREKLNKINTNWSGPATILKVTPREDSPSVNYVCQNTRGLTQTKHHNDLRPFTVPQKRIPKPLLPASPLLPPKPILRSSHASAPTPLHSVDPDNTIMTRSKTTAFLLGSLYSHDDCLPSTSPIVNNPVAPTAANDSLPNPPPTLAINQPTPATPQPIVNETSQFRDTRIALSPPSLSPSPPVSLSFLNPSDNRTSRLEISPQTITSTIPNIFTQMRRPHEQTYSDSHDETEALYPGPIDNETSQNQIPNPVFDCQPSTPTANRTVLIVDDPNSLLPRSDAGESRYQFRKRKQSKPLSAVKKRFKKTRAKKTRAGPNSMSDVCDKLKTCAIQAPPFPVSYQIWF